MKRSICQLSKLTLCLVSAVLFSTLALASGGGSDPAGEFARSGPYSTTSHSGGLSCTIYRPRNLSDQHPVIIWGNGTGSSPSTYGSGLRHWASWGFVVAAANTSNAGSGQTMLGCLDYLASSDLRDNIDFSNVGASGHSQGGGGAIMAGQSSQVKVTAPMQPYVIGLGHSTSSQYNQNGRMLLLSGSSDYIASPTLNQAPVFERTNVPVFWATRSGASHFEPIGSFGDFAGISTAYFRYHLSGDEDARSLFEGSDCGFCRASGWDVERKGD